MSNTPLGNLFSGLNKALDSRVARAVGMRRLLERASYRSAYYGVKLVTRSAGAFKSSGKQKKSARLNDTGRSSLFDLNLTEEQSMIADAVGDFVAQQVTPNAEKCSEEGQVPDEIYAGFNELGMSYYAVPEELGGALTEKCTVTQMILSETLAKGDTGMALALLTPLGVLNALVRYGNAGQQEKYIPPFLEEGNKTVAAIAVNEPQALFDPFDLSTTAVQKDGSYVLNGSKSILPLASTAAFFFGGCTNG